MTLLELQSEKYSALGNLASEGMQNQLGRPRLDPLTVLIRESVQNSWDAHDPEHPHIRYEVDLIEADAARLEVLDASVFAATPPNFSIRERIEEAREGGPPLHLLVLSDRETSGLGGPTRADVLLEDDDEPHDFVDFLRNIGQPPDKPLGGGTYGYGKAALYAVSRHRTLIVYTRCRHKGRSERRLFVAGLGHGFTVREGAARGRYTGRHWWGRIVRGVVEPLIDGDAQEVAAGLGLPDFKDHEHGTSIAIVDADFGLERGPAEALEVLQEALLWNFWPKLVRANPERPPISFFFRWNGELLPLPALAERPPLDGFANAMELLKARRAGLASRHFGYFDEIWCKRPKRLLGWLALYRFETQRRPPSGEGETGAIEGSCHHVALMRDAELVVRYLDGVPLQTDRFEYAGVFIATREVDRAFADSEPPTHDDWVWQNLDDSTHRTLVRVALRRIQEQMKDFAQPTGGTRTGGQLQIPLGHLSSSLGNLLTGLTGPGANRPKLDQKARVRAKGPVVEVTPAPKPEPDLFDGGQEESPVEQNDQPAPDHKGAASGDQDEASTTTPVPRPRPGRPGVTTGQPRLVVRDGAGVLEIELQIQHGRHSDGTLVSAVVAAELDGEAVEKNPPAGAAVPQVVCWVPAGGEPLGHGEEKHLIRAEQSPNWTLVLSLVDDATVRASISAAPYQDPT